ncbi:MAG: DUF4301 family protein [Dysgonamonadaceae bacterium]|jgi:hypothetical protein|nr:DUF4301 family protein [Dysgonamonadaceae bacterium]
MLTKDDLKLLSTKGISVRKINEQLNFFKKGFPFLNVVASASNKRGIKEISEGDKKIYLTIWNAYLEQDREIVKFVPASGAASRMFKDLFEFLAAGEPIPKTPFEQVFFAKIHTFAFYQSLNECCVRNENKTVDQLLEEENYRLVVENLLFDKGLNYGQLPKGLILFHAYPEGARTAMEEHLVEGARYARNGAQRVNIHFTVSPEHKALFEALIREKTPQYAQVYDADFRIEVSEQKSSTETPAVDLENEPFREDSRLLFRPGGHGALIENLNDITGDIVFIKNIDNVVPDTFKSVTVQQKQLLAGILVNYQQKIFSYLQQIDSGKYTHNQLLEMLYFLQKELCIKNPETKMLEDAELVLYIKSKLNRPLRVCGMVRNTGEPGGGPFFAENPDGTISLQILERSQIDLKDVKKKALLDASTHFNPVDLVCALKNYQGEKFNLTRYVDKRTGFISLKSKNGKELKAMELPGLWNGAMSDWNTIFVEVPIETFNPVKTVNDLLRPEHQNG